LSVEILAIGNELLLGLTQDTSAHWLSQKITNVGGTVHRITMVEDDVDEISSVIKDSLARKPDWLIISGGLGPTYDDKTIQGVAAALGVKVVLDNTAVEMLEKSYARCSRKYELNEIRLKMAKIPLGSIPIQNPIGSAPSVLIETQGRTKIVCLPGVPKEMEAIFSGSVLPQLTNTIGKYYVNQATYDTTGVTEAMLTPLVSEIVHSNPRHSIYLKTHPQGYIRNRDHKNEPRLRVQIISKGTDKHEVEQRFDNISMIILEQISKLNGKVISRI
jgi:nicotinamide-nucleotide amidase